MNVREKTGIIIQRDGEFLVGVIYGTYDTRWSASPWDAWITRRKDQAARVAAKVGGRMVLFNPVAGQIRGID